MTELSTEAAVAGQAAASAVEEVQARAAVAERAELAEIEASGAHGAAIEAQETAQLAALEAEHAHQAASQASDDAREVASETLTAVAERTVPREDFEALRAEVAPLLEYHARAEAERLAAEQSQDENQVQEVGVEDGIGSGGNGGTGNSGPDRGDSPPVTSRRGRLRRGRR